jgi:hypothetical protein
VKLDKGGKYVKAYSHVVGGYNTDNSKGYVSAHTEGLGRQFDLTSTIRRSNDEHYGPSRDGRVYIESGRNNWGNIGQPMVLFTSENPAFRLALGVKNDTGYLSDRGEDVINLNLPENVAEKAMKDGVITSKVPIWADFADEVIDLVRGEILKHKYRSK